MKRINSVRQIKKHLRLPFKRVLQFTVTTYGDTFYHTKKNVLIDHVESYYIWDNFKSRIVNITFKRRFSVGESEDYKLFKHYSLK
jgi:UDP-galactopyranose mutase